MSGDKIKKKGETSTSYQGQKVRREHEEGEMDLGE